MLDQYRDLAPGHRQNIINELDKLGSHQAEGLTPFLESLSELLRWESGSNAVYLADLLEGCLSEYAETIDTETLKSLGELACSTEQQTKRIGLRALRILTQRDPTAIENTLSSDTVEERLAGGPDERAHGYRILGVTAAEGAISQLADALYSEGEPARGAAKKGLEDIAAISVSWLDGERAAEGARNLENLTEQVPDVTVKYQDELRHGLTAESKSIYNNCVTALIRLGYSECCDQLDEQAFLDGLEDCDRVAAGRATGVVIGGQPDVDPDVVHRIIDQIENSDDSDQQHVLLVALLQIAKRTTGLVAQYAERLRNLDSRLPSRARSDYIDLLGEVISDTDNPGTIAPLLLKEIESASDEYVKNACQNLSETNLYPLPPAVHRARTSEDDSISTVAHRVYQRSEKPSFSVSDHLEEGDGDSALEQLRSALHYKSRPGRWDPLSLPQPEFQRLAKVQEQYRNGSGGYMFLPHDVPDIGILSTAELALTGLQLEQNLDILIYSPGTGSQWGTYEDLRTLFREIGLAENGRITTAVLPFDEIVSICKVVDGQVTEWEETDSNVRVILTRSLKDIQEVTPDAIICNFLGRRPAEFETKLDEVQETIASCPVFSIYSFTAKIEAPRTYPEYGYPENVPEASCQLLPGAPTKSPTPQPEKSGISTPAEMVTTQLTRLESERSLTVERLALEKISDRLNTMHHLTIEMESKQTERVASVFREQTRFVQSLPVPLDIWDEWVREESTGAGQYANDPSHQRIEDVDELREDPPRAAVPGTVYEYLTELQDIFELLRQNNPTYERLLEEIETRIESGEQLAVLFRKRSSQEAFKYALQEERGLSTEELSERGIYILRLDALRQLNGVSNLILPQPFPPSQGQLYLSPLYDSMRLLVYEQGTDEYLSEQVVERLESVQSRQQVPENIDWPAQPTIESQTRSVDDVAGVSEKEMDEDISTVDTSRDRGLSELWAQFEPDLKSVTETADATHDYGDDTADAWTVQILTENGVELLKTSDESVLINRTQGPMASGRFVWATVNDIQPDDTFIVIP
jgi:hypothetical protein